LLYFEGYDLPASCPCRGKPLRCSTDLPLVTVNCESTGR
jgi:hypothetical protein